MIGGSNRRLYRTTGWTMSLKWTTTTRTRQSTPLRRVGRPLAAWPLSELLKQLKATRSADADKLAAENERLRRENEGWRQGKPPQDELEARNAAGDITALTELLYGGRPGPLGYRNTNPYASTNPQGRRKNKKEDGGRGVHGNRDAGVGKEDWHPLIERMDERWRAKRNEGGSCADCVAGKLAWYDDRRLRRGNPTPLELASPSPARHGGKRVELPSTPLRRSPAPTPYPCLPPRALWETWGAGRNLPQENQGSTAPSTHVDARRRTRDTATHPWHPVLTSC